MTHTPCPTCGLVPATQAETAPDITVVQWFKSAPAWSGQMSTDEVYGQYLRDSNEAPVSRRRFVSDLAFLGIEEVLDDEVYMLDRR
ncbi:hypothetical protein GCM10027519_42830 [Kineococcus endophyticus]